MMFLIYFILFLFLIIDYLKDKSITSPIKIFNIVWIVFLSLYNLKISTLQVELIDRTKLIFFIIILIFNIFALLSSKFKATNGRKIYNPKSSINKRIKIVNIIFISLFILECIYSKSVPLLSMFLTGNSNYMHFGIPTLHGALNGLAICMGSYFLFKKNKSKYIYILFGILMISRQVLLSMAIEGVVFSLLENSEKIKNKIKKINFKKYIILGIIVILMFGFLGNLRSGNDTMKNIFYPRKGYENLPSTVMWVYSYSTFSIGNFNKLVSLTDGGLNHGISTLSFFVPTILLNKLPMTMYSFKYYILGNFNASTAFPELYLDFGTIGLAIFSAIIGMIGMSEYKKQKEYGNTENWLKYSVFIHNVILLFFANMFLYISILVQFIYIPLIFRENKKNIKKGSETNET